jgi:hypothetical protein
MTVLHFFQSAAVGFLMAVLHFFLGTMMQFRSMVS